MQRLLSSLTIHRKRIAFPGRVRIVAAPGREAALEAQAWPVEWPGADAGEGIAGMGGAAVWEQARGGLVVAIVDGRDIAAGTLMPALITTARLGVPCVLAVADPDPGQRAIVSAAGWTWVDSIDVVAGPSAIAISAEIGEAPLPVRPGRWAPVRLFSLRDWLAQAGNDPLADLSALALREPRLLLPHLTAPWRDLQPTAALLAVLAAASGEGRCVCWHVPQELDLRDCAPVLRRITGRGRALILVVDRLDTESLGFWSSLPGWWLAVAADVGEFRALLARSLGADDALVIARPSTALIAPWPTGANHEAGTGRWLTADSPACATIICAGGLASEALRAHQALAAMAVPVAVYHLTSLQPLPEHDLVSAASRGPLVVADDGDPALGLAGAIARLGISVVPVGHRPLAADLAAAVRTALA